MRPSRSPRHRFIRRIASISLNSLTYFDLFFTLFARGFVRTGKRKFQRADWGAGTSRVLIAAIYVNTVEEFETFFKTVLEIKNEIDFIIFVNTGRFRLETDRNLDCVFISRPNVGRDLASLQEAVSFLSLQKLSLSELIYINDSVLWLPGSLGNYLEKCRRSSSRITGMTASVLGGFHLQSYALHIKDPDDLVFVPILKILPYRFKRTTIKFGEIGMSKHWRKSGFSVSPLYPEAFLIEQVAKYQSIYEQDWSQLKELIFLHVGLNPTIHFWPIIFDRAGIIKKGLIRENPAKFLRPPLSVQDAISRIKENRK